MNRSTFDRTWDTCVLFRLIFLCFMFFFFGVERVDRFVRVRKTKKKTKSPRGVVRYVTKRNRFCFLFPWKGTRFILRGSFSPSLNLSRFVSNVGFQVKMFKKKRNPFSPPTSFESIVKVLEQSKKRCVSLIERNERERERSIVLSFPNALGILFTNVSLPCFETKQQQ